MTVFLSYARRDERFATQVATKVLASGREVWTFEFSELVDGPHDFLRECRACFVVISRESPITETVRLANRLLRGNIWSRAFCDETWDPDPQSQLMLTKISPMRPEKIAFDIDIVFRRFLVLIDGQVSDESPPEEQAYSFKVSELSQVVSLLNLLKLKAEPEFLALLSERLEASRQSLAVRPDCRRSLGEFVPIVTDSAPNSLAVGKAGYLRRIANLMLPKKQKES